MITKVGVGILIVDDHDRALIGKRKGSHGAGEWGFPGGTVEYMEDIYSAAKREILEEVGPDFYYYDLRLVIVSNLTKYAPKHFIDFGLAAKFSGGTPKVMEPDKVESWVWADINNLPQPAFGLEEFYVKAYKAGKSIEMITL